MKTPKKKVSRRKFIKKSGLLSSVPVIAAGLPASSLANVQDANEFLRLGWIGVGGRGTSLLDRALRSVSVSTLKVNAICDIDPKARARGIRMCGAMKPAGIHDYKELLARKDIDAVFVATPIYLHPEHAVAVLESGKHCYCEKPLGPTPEGVKKIYDAVKKSGKKFQVGFQWRYHSGFLGFVDQLQGGAVGKTSFINSARHVGGYPEKEGSWYMDRKLSGDLIVEQAVHEMNVFCWALDAHPLRAAGFGGINALEGRPKGRSMMDSYGVTYEFPGNIRLNYTHVIYAASGFGGLYMTVFGDAGKALELEGTVNLSVTKDGKKTKVDLPPLKDSTELAIQSFARSIREDKEPLANVDAGRHATLMSLLGRTAIHEKRVVEWKEVAL